MNNHFLRYWLPVIFWAVLIFTLSSFSFFPKPIEPIFSFDEILHMIEYAVLSILLARALRNSPRHKLKQNFRILAILFTILYAVSDEAHQYFVPMRTPSFSDLFFDSLGACIGQIFFRA